VETIEAIGVNVPGLITQVVNLFLLLILLYFFLYKPVLRMFDQRSQRIKESLEQAEKMRLETTEGEEEIQRKLAEAREQGQTLIAQASEASARLRADGVKEAGRQADDILARARVEIQRERDEAIESVRREFGHLAITAAERVIRQSLDRQSHQTIIDEVLQQGGQQQNG